METNKDLNEHLPLVALDVDIFLSRKLKSLKLFDFGELLSIEVAELCCLRLKQQLVIVILCPYVKDWQLEKAQDALDPAIYNYFIPVNTKNSFEMFRDQYLPHSIYSNIPKKWQGEYSDVISFPEEKSWQFVFQNLRESVSF
jgi:hypothetical protein